MINLEKLVLAVGLLKEVFPITFLSGIFGLIISTTYQAEARFARKACRDVPLYQISLRLGPDDQSTPYVDYVLHPKISSSITLGQNKGSQRTTGTS